MNKRLIRNTLAIVIMLGSSLIAMEQQVIEDGITLQQLIKREKVYAKRKRTSWRIDLSSKQLKDLSGLSELKVDLDGVEVSIKEVKNLRLNLSNNLLRELPKEIGQLRELLELNLSNNLFKELPPEIVGELVRLWKLDLSNNQLKELPTEIGQLVQLHKLFLSNNQLRELPSEMGQLYLVELELSNNRLNKLPNEIGQLEHLVGLDLSNNQLSELPKEIGQLVNLWYLDLRNNNLTGLPIEIGKLVILRELNVSNNQLRELPSEMGQLVELWYLELRNTNLTRLPKEIVKLKALEQIDLMHNGFGKDASGSVLESVSSIVKKLINNSVTDVEEKKELALWLIMMHNNEKCWLGNPLDMAVGRFELLPELKQLILKLV